MILLDVYHLNSYGIYNPDYDDSGIEDVQTSDRCLWGNINTERWC